MATIKHDDITSADWNDGISDDDNDTKWECEQSADEDILRGTVGGVEKVDISSSGLAIDVITEKTATAGVTIDSVLLKDNGVTATNLTGTLQTAAQGNVTSLGTLTTLTVDNVTINGNDVSSGSGDLTLTPPAGSSVVIDGAIDIDAGVVTGATSITSTAFVGDITGAVTGNADTVTNGVYTTDFPLNQDTTGKADTAGNADTVTNGVYTTDYPLNQNTTGTAASWTTGRTITLTGDCTGVSGAWTGSGNISFVTTVGNNSHTHNDSTVDALNASAITAGTLSDARLPATISSNITGSSATCTGLAASATKWATARTFDIIGDVTGTGVSFDGTANVTFTAVVGNNSHTHNDSTIDSLNASAITAGTLSDARLPSSITSSITGNAATASAWFTGRTITLSGDVTGTSSSWTGSGNATMTTVVGNDTHSHGDSTINGLNASATTAGTFATARLPTATTSAQGAVELATTAETTTGTATNRAVTPDGFADCIQTCKAWINYDGSTNSIKRDYNVTSVTDNGTGDFTLNFSITMPSAEYAMFGHMPIGSSATTVAHFHGQAKSTTAVRFLCMDTNPSSQGFVERENICVAIFA